MVAARDGLPLPLGVNVARRDIERLDDLSEVLAEAIRCGLENRDEALEYALQFGRGIDEAVADRFIEMYVNELTQDYGEEGRAAVAELLRRGEAIGAFRSPCSSISSSNGVRERLEPHPPCCDGDWVRLKPLPAVKPR